jgi:2-keto-3-deoxy-L-rhamnonate aldolase RhmA
LAENASFEIVQGASHESLISDREHARVVAKTILSVVHAAHDRERQAEFPRGRPPEPPSGALSFATG